jgi:endoglucanase
MKLILAFVALIFVTDMHAQPVKLHGQLHVDSTQLKDQHGQPVVLRGMSFGWHNFWPRFYNAGAVGWLHKDWNCTVIRAAMGIEPAGGYKQDSAGAKQKIRAVVDAAIKEGIYVIIDWHSHNINLQEAKDFFIEMAKKYGRYPNVIYELFNEPDYETWEQVKAYSTEIITAIRAIDPDNIILVGSPHWDQDILLPANDPIKGFKNLMYTMHYYAATHKQFLRDRCDEALKKGLPIFISESAGMEASGDGPLNVEEWQKWIDWSEKNKVSWITWSVSDKDETCSVLKKSAASEGGWTEADLKESGVRVRKILRDFKKN